MKTEWTLTRDAFDNLLLWLSPDRDEAGRKYEEIRGKLVRLFIHRGCDHAEDLADETINRVIRKAMEFPTSEYSGDPILYFFAVAKNVYLEWRRKKLIFPQDVMPMPHVDREEELDCLDSCLEELTQYSRHLITNYYQHTGREKIKIRKSLANESGGMNTLRIQACRIRKALRKCVSACIERVPAS